MDTTTGGAEPLDQNPAAMSVPELIASLETADAAQAPEIASEIARQLAAALDAVPGASGGEQLQAFDAAGAEED